MGYTMLKVAEIHVDLSSHNSEQDDIDYALASLLTSELRAVIDDPKYERILSAASWVRQMGAMQVRRRSVKAAEPPK